MKKEEVLIDGKKIKVVVEIPEEEKDDMVLVDELEHTLDLEQLLDTIMKISVGESNE